MKASISSSSSSSCILGAGVHPGLRCPVQTTTPRILCKERERKSWRLKGGCCVSICQRFDVAARRVPGKVAARGGGSLVLLLLG
ncbi:Hypothetical predicted protein [Podarcis lilfordi]|uniref:Uncharacterized protein n=1 Tax=Podarcis lilfordi TaxID=74358 RepID=A0AA35K8J3_9SAUR|nr:Hypothetical predicted protein [Podarcis lilfordi]